MKLRGVQCCRLSSTFPRHCRWPLQSSFLLPPSALQVLGHKNLLPARKCMTTAREKLIIDYIWSSTILTHTLYIPDCQWKPKRKDRPTGLGRSWPPGEQSPADNLQYFLLLPRPLYCTEAFLLFLWKLYNTLQLMISNLILWNKWIAILNLSYLSGCLRLLQCTQCGRTALFL